MSDLVYPNTPECDKLSAVEHNGRRAEIQQFIDWLYDEKGWRIAELLPLYDSGQSPLELCDVRVSREQIMAEYFGIDLKARDKEQKAVLDYVRQRREQADQQRGMGEGMGEDGQ